jgi:hypothetical protein
MSGVGGKAGHTADIKNRRVSDSTSDIGSNLIVGDQAERRLRQLSYIRFKRDLSGKIGGAGNG